ncbi:hypothetical protein NL50_12765 [Clostridium acetobutylicum]|nr:hypothetical protein NL50_12765 [Clostridium acetobutylicum]
MKVSYEILYRGNSTREVRKTNEKSARIKDSKEGLFDEWKHKAEDFLNFASKEGGKIIHEAQVELGEAFKETENFVSKAIDRLNKSLADFKYIGEVY